ncbi:MAG: indole-3-glycerol phosphate synthase TrpC [Verrucomicrobiota bacterium]
MMFEKLPETMPDGNNEIQLLYVQEQDLKRQALLRNDYRGFRQVLHQPGIPTVIAELKSESPSAAWVVEDFDLVAQAAAYAAAGANALSVLTDKNLFQESRDLMRQVLARTTIPVLRRERILEPVQIYDAVVSGADAILLTVSAMKQEQVQRLYECARLFPVDIVVEVHDLQELDMALDLGADIIAVNNRSRANFRIDLQTTAGLAQEIPSDCLGICLGGIKNADDVSFCREQGIDCFLTGEIAMSSDNIKPAINELLGRGV